MAWERERERVLRQEAPGVLAFRVLVMLSCLILVPAAAIFGSAFPELVRTHLVDRLKSLSGLISRDVAAPAADARLAAPPSVPPGNAPAWNSAEPAPAWQPPVDSQVHPAAYPAYPATAHQVEYSESEPIASPAEAEGSPGTASALPLAGSSPAASAASNGDHFTEIQRRLREYGASYYALEAVGKQGELYRFCCTLSDPTGQSRSFSVTDRDPLQAMHRVLQDVEAWRSHAFAPNDTLRR